MKVSPSTSPRPDRWSGTKTTDPVNGSRGHGRTFGTNQRLTWTYAASAKNTDMNTWQARQITQRHGFASCSLQTSSMSVSQPPLSPPDRAGRKGRRNQASFRSDEKKKPKQWGFVRLIEETTSNCHAVNDHFSSFYFIVHKRRHTLPFAVSTLRPGCSGRQNERTASDIKVASKRRHDFLLFFTK